MQWVSRPASIRTIWSLAVTLIGAAWLAPAGRAADPDPGEGAKFFRDKIAPVLERQCYECHSAGASKVRGGLRLDSRAAILKGGDTGPAVVLGKGAESLLIQALRLEDGLEMPPDKPKLSDQTIADFVTWVGMGAP
ncbi:c-type cytochrome domain-containing protein, partial [Singulisphaera rosea]